MDNTPKISVIIPVYNSEQYLDECIGSLQNQTMDEYEIICVDNGSSDNSVPTLEKLRTANSSKISLLSVGGTAGDARNLGLEHAQGEYLLFLDSDDFFDPSLLETTYRTASRYDAEVVLFGASRFDHQNRELIQSSVYLNTALLPNENCFSATDVPASLFQLTLPNPWTKLFKRSFILEKGLRFQSLENSNDYFFCYSALASANRISSIDADLVRYRFNTGKSMQDTKERNPLCFIEALYALDEYLKSQHLDAVLRKTYQASLIEVIKYNLTSAKNYSTRRIILEALTDRQFNDLDLLGHEKSYYRSEYAYNSARLIESIMRLHSFNERQELEAIQQPVSEEANNKLIFVYSLFLDYYTFFAKLRKEGDDVALSSFLDANSHFGAQLEKARSVYSELDSPEKAAFSYIAPAEYCLFKPVIEEYSDLMSLKNQEISNLNSKNKELKNSRAYQLGTRLLKPLRSVKRSLSKS